MSDFWMIFTARILLGVVLMGGYLGIFFLIRACLKIFREMIVLQRKFYKGQFTDLHMEYIIERAIRKAREAPKP